MQQVRVQQQQKRAGYPDRGSAQSLAEQKGDADRRSKGNQGDDPGRAERHHPQPDERSHRDRVAGGPIEMLGGDVRDPPSREQESVVREVVAKILGADRSPGGHYAERDGPDKEQQGNHKAPSIPGRRQDGRAHTVDEQGRTLRGRCSDVNGYLESM